MGLGLARLGKLGLPASGKSTITKHLQDHIQQHHTDYHTLTIAYDEIIPKWRHPNAGHADDQSDEFKVARAGARQAVKQRLQDLPEKYA